MIDDERLQELLAKASSLYNNGEYSGAIAAWQEALGVDPGSQKAREGIRMATLLIGDSEPAPSAEPVDVSPLPADGAEPPGADSPAEENEARLALGAAQLKQLIAERKYAEAIEGAQGLLPLDPESPEIHALLEQAQQAFESIPFIEEHLTLSRELLAQDRFAEAEAECKKVFTLDAAHPGAKGLLKEIRDKIQSSLKAAASQLGGMTVKLSMPQVVAAGKPAAAKPPAVPAAPIPEVHGDPMPSELAGQDLQPGDLAGTQEEVAARDALEAAFKDQADAMAAEESPFEISDGSFGGQSVPGPAPVAPAGTAASQPKPEIVEAKTVRPATSRVVPKAPEAAPSAPVEPPPVVAGKKKEDDTAHTAPPAPKMHGSDAAPVKPAAPQPAVPKAAAPHPAPKPATTPKPEADHPAAPDGAGKGDAPASWESELTQLNLSDKQRGLLRGTGAKATGAPVEAGDVDLMSLFDAGGMPGLSGNEAQPPAPEPAAPVAAKPAKGAPSKPAPEAVEAPAETTAPATRKRTVEKSKPVPSASPRSGRPFLKLLLLLILLGGSAAAVYFFAPPDLLARYLGRGGQPVAPPANTPSGGVEGAHGPIPTPIGGTSRQQPATAPPGSGASTSAVGIPPAAGAASGAIGQPPVAGSGAVKPGQAAPGGTVPTTAAGNPAEPIKPAATPALSKEETERRVAAFTADGKRLMALGKWREARAKLNAVLALDPANIEVKELADQAQSKLDDQQKLDDEFESTKQAFNDKDYENALRKLYRLPRDKGFGNIDLYIRNSWYNWAVVLLKAGNSKDALVKLSEELTIDPDDAGALKLQEVAEKYSNRAKDRTYYAFTDGLTLRALDQK